MRGRLDGRHETLQTELYGYKKEGKNVIKTRYTGLNWNVTIYMETCLNGFRLPRDYHLHDAEYNSAVNSRLALEGLNVPRRKILQTLF